MRLHTLVSMIVALTLPALVQAEVRPGPGKKDPRVRTVDYDPDDIVVVSAAPGVLTHIQFGRGEKIDKEDVDAADRKAWIVTLSTNREHLFVRPRNIMAESNLTLVSNRNRVYLFALEADRRPMTVKRKDGKRVLNGDVLTSAKLTYSLRFRYPEDEAAAAAAAAAKATKKNDKEKIGAALAAPQPYKNTNYFVSVPDASLPPLVQQAIANITPTAAYDDGRFTYLTFDNGAKIPSLYTDDAPDKPSLVRTVVVGNTMVVHAVLTNLTLRRGTDAVVCLQNRTTGQPGASSASGTTSPDVRRVLKDEGDAP